MEGPTFIPNELGNMIMRMNWYGVVLMKINMGYLLNAWYMLNSSI